MEKYTDTALHTQIDFDLQGYVPPVGCLLEPAGLKGFQQKGFNWDLSFEDPDRTARTHLYRGIQQPDELDKVCAVCGGRAVPYDHRDITLRHVPSGDAHTKLEIERIRWRCACCGSTTPVQIPYRAEGHRITVHLEYFVEDMLRRGYTHTQVQEATGLDRHAIKDIHKRMLEGRYLEGGKLKRPEKPTDVLGIDEFLLHKGHQYATIICDMRTGHILWIAHGKTKQVVTDFIRHVGMEWMSGVRAICCDMNAGFANAFQEACPDLKIVFDRFHIIKHFNEDVLDNVRKDEAARLHAEGNHEAANALKRSKYVLRSSRDTLEKKDAADREELEKAASGEAKDKPQIFDRPPRKLRTDRISQYEGLVKENKLLIAADLVKDMLGDAYGSTATDDMREKVTSIIQVCRDTENPHFEKFAGLLDRHLDGIVSHAEFPYSSGLMEGTVNKIKAVRRKAYGYRDDDFFFLLAMDATRRRTS